MTTVTLLGTVESQPKLYQSSHDSGLAYFSVLSRNVLMEESGDVQRENQYKVVVLDKNAVRICEQYLIPGHIIALRGQLESREILEENGIVRQEEEIIIHKDGHVSLIH